MIRNDYPLKTKIYIDDPLLPYKTTKLSALYTKSEIDGLFAKFGIKYTMWCWDIQNIDVSVIFRIQEVIDGQPVDVQAKVEAYPVWIRKSRAKPEMVNWNITMRTMYWFIKTHLEAAYLQHTNKIVSFLPYIVTSNGRKFHELALPKITTLPDTLALEDQNNQRTRPITVDSSHIIDQDSEK